MDRIRKYLFRFITLFVFIYALLCFLVYFFPEIFLYHPKTEEADLVDARKNGYLAEKITYESKDGVDLYGWYTKGYDKNKVIFFSHGNACNLDCFYFKLIPFQNRGYSTFLPEYRGFGGIDEEITQKGLLEDMKAGLNELYKMGYKNEDIIVYGMSLGSHQATSLVYNMKKEGKFDALVLEVPFDSVPNTAKNIFFLPMPFDFLFKDRYDNLELIQDIETRLLIQIAKEDTIVPAIGGMNLYNKAKNPKDIIVYEGAGHNDLYNYKNYIDIIEWLEK